MSHVEKRIQAGRVTYRARYRDPSGRERKRSFNRKTDAQRFLVSIEDAKLRGAYVDPGQGQSRLRGVDRTLVCDHGGSQAWDPAHLQDAARQSGSPPLRQDDPGRHRHN